MNLFTLALIIPLQAAQVPPKGFIPKPISDDDWNAIAGSKLSEQFEIHRGDSLYRVSERLFGDGKYWPKIWAINQGSITNPHLIFPGQVIAFESGTMNSLPRLSVMSDASSSLQVGESRRKGRSSEWKGLPRQRWEPVKVKTENAVDPLGFDKNSRILFRRSDGRRAPFLVTESSLPTFGTVDASDRSGGILSTIDDRIYIQASAALTVGERYTVTEDPLSIDGGYAYRNISTIAIKEAMGDGLYSATILENGEGIRQGSHVVAYFQNLKDLAPIPATTDVSGTIGLDPVYSSSYVAEHDWVFINQGSAQGVSPGMVFRHYVSEDVESGRPLPETKATRNADFLVLQSSAHASLAIGIYSRFAVKAGSNVRLLQDVSDLMGHGGSTVKTLERNDRTDRNELDDLDGPSDLNDSERNELEQLENHNDQSPSTQELPPADDGLSDITPDAAPSDLPPPEDLPPPADLPPPEDLPPPADGITPPAESAPSAPPQDPFLEE